jgi:TPR repeat protein
MIVLIVSVISATVIVPLLTEIDPAVLAGILADEVLDGSKLKRAAENGDPAAQFKLGVTLFEDPARTGEASAQAIRWLEAAAESGNVDAMVYLGRVLQSGVGILQDFSQAFRWFHAAAMRDSPEGMLETGRLYRDGIGIEKNPVRAYVWFNRAAAAHNIEAVREREAIGAMLKPDDWKEAQRQSSQPVHKGGGNSRRNARD